MSDEALDAADVLIWWGRRRHDDVPAGRAAAVVERVKAGRLGFVALHGACASQPFRTLMGTACEPAHWREDGRPEHVGIAAPEHPIARGVASVHDPQDRHVRRAVLGPGARDGRPGLELGAGRDDAERPDLDASATGRVVYLRPGHDAFPVLFHPVVRQVIANAAVWAAHRA